MKQPRSEAALLALLFALSVVPFLGRPIHIDEPVFLWAAEHISQHPGDFYGFEINWTGTVAPVHQVMMNPPLASYLIAFAALLVGWSATALHACFALVSLAALLGTYVLARRLCERPLLAGLAFLWTPGFLVSSTLLMSDVLCVALWVWAVICWDHGLRRQAAGPLLLGALLAGFAGLTEYFGIALVPLLALQAAVTTRRVGYWLPALIIPAAMLLGFHLLTERLYGSGLLARAGDFASTIRSEESLSNPVAERVFKGLAFLGGCAASVLFLAPGLIGRRAMLAWVATGLAVLVVCLGLFAPVSIGIQAALWSTTGIAVLALAVDDLRSRRDPDSLLLFAWVMGTFVFAAFLYWQVNARSILPLLPAVAILLARRLDRHPAQSLAAGRPFALGAGLAASAVLAIGVTWADFSLARSAQAAAQGFVRQLIAGGERVWIQGHWGFQYYAQQLGARSIDKNRSLIEKGDLVVVPFNNSHVSKLPPRFFEIERGIDLGFPSFISTMNIVSGAAFHSASFGPLPFAFGPARSERYLLLRAKRPYRFLDANAGDREL